MKYLRRFALFIMVCLCCSCSTISEVVTRGAEVNDEALNAAEFTVCFGASVGAVKRKYNTPEKAELWRNFCSVSDSEFTPNNELRGIGGIR